MDDDKKFQQLSLDSFRRLPVDMRIQCVEFVHNIYSQDEGYVNDKAYIIGAIKANPYTWWAPDHHGWGTWMRNSLRELFTDEKLPPTQYKGVEYSNWDDYYIGIVEVAFREGIYHLLDESERV